MRNWTFERSDNDHGEWRFLAGKRPLAGRVTVRPHEGIVDLNAWIANGAFQLRMSGQQLHRQKILRSPIDQ